MKTIIQVSYLYGLLPLLIGLAFTCITRRYSSSRLRRGGISYVLGYLIYLALFECIVLWELKKTTSYIVLVNDWKRVILSITIISVICILIRLLSLCTKDLTSDGEAISFLSKSEIKKSPENSRYLLASIITSLVLLLISVFLLFPHALDDTPELARLTISNDSFFSIDPLTGKTYASGTVFPGKIHLFYAFGSTLTGINVTTLIHRIIPVFMIPLFIMSYAVISELLFAEEKQDKKHFAFVGLVILFYVISIPFETHISVAVFRNIWNGTTLAASCFFPLLFSICLSIARYPTHKTVSGLTTVVLSIPESVVSIICLSLAIHLCVPYGLPICGLFVLASILVLLSSVVQQRRIRNHNSSVKEGECS